MGIYSNSPTMTWVSLTGISVTKGDEVFVVKDFKTNLKYIYWDYTNPYIFTASNVLKDTSTNIFQVAINDKGSFIEVPQETISVSYDGNSEKALSEHVWGLHEKADEFTNKFVSVEQDISGITTTVGEHTEQMGLLEENISKVDQKADEINLSVQETKKEFNDNKDMMNLRESVNLSIINLNSALGVYKSLLNDYFKDSVVSADEKVQIQSNNNILTEKKNIMLSEMDKVIALMQEQSNQVNVDTITRDKQLLETSITNLISLINTAISDNTIVPSEITTVINAFAKSNLDINEIKNSIDNMIFLGVGGKLSEEVASIDIKSDQIVSKVESVEKTVTSQGTTISSHSSSISQIAGEIQTKVSAGEISSTINQTAQSVRINASKINLDGYVTFTNLSTSGQTTIDGGNIATNTISVDSLKSNNANPIIRLFGGCAIDATNKYEQGQGSDIRFKWNSSNYLKIGSDIFEVYTTTGGESPTFKFYGGRATQTITTQSATLTINGNGLSHNGTDLSKVGHTHPEYVSSSVLNNYATVSSLSNYATLSTLSNYATNSSLSNYVPRYSSSYIQTGSIDPYYDASYNLGYSSKRWNQVSAVAFYGNFSGSSDISLKENIRYLDINESTPFSNNEFINENVETKSDLIIDKEDLFNFIKDDLKLTQYNYIDTPSGEKFGNKVNFIANDIVDTKVGSIICAEHEGKLAYNLNNYVSIIAGALQEEIKKREELEERLKVLEEMILNK